MEFPVFAFKTLCFMKVKCKWLLQKCVIELAYYILVADSLLKMAYLTPQCLVNSRWTGPYIAHFFCPAEHSNHFLLQITLVYSHNIPISLFYSF